MPRVGTAMAAFLRFEIVSEVPHTAQKKGSFVSIQGRVGSALDFLASQAMPCRLLISARCGVTCAARALPTALQLCLTSWRKLHSQIHLRRPDYAPNAMVEEALLFTGRRVGITPPGVVPSATLDGFKRSTIPVKRVPGPFS